MCQFSICMSHRCVNQHARKVRSARNSCESLPLPDHMKCPVLMSHRSKPAESRRAVGRAPSSTAAISVRGSSPSTYSAQSWVYHSRSEFENLFDWILRLMQHDNGGFYLVVGPWSRYQKNYTRPCFPKPCNGTTRVTSPNNAIWNQIEVGGRSIQQSISVWWRGTDDAPPLFLVDSFWNATAVVPSTASVRINDDGADDASKIGAGRAPIVPWYDSHFFTNPSCRGYPWY